MRSAFRLLSHNVEHRVNEFRTLGFQQVHPEAGHAPDPFGCNQEQLKLSSGLQCNDLNFCQARQTLTLCAASLANGRPTLGPVVASSLQRTVIGSHTANHTMLPPVSEANPKPVLSVQRRSCRDGRADRKAQLGRSPWFLESAALAQRDMRKEGSETRESIITCGLNLTSFLLSVRTP